MAHRVKSYLIEAKNATLRPYYLVRTVWPIWWRLNGKSRAMYEGDTTQHSLGAEEKRIASELKQNGIAISHLDILLGPEWLPKLQAYANNLRMKAVPSAKKTFLLALFNRLPEIDLANPFFQLALNEKILATINGYLEMYAKFFITSLNVTLPVGNEAPPKDSQRWHRDPEDKKMTKIFLYLNDVDDLTGPFTYIKDSHYGGRWRSIFRQRPPHGYYPPDGAIEKIIPRSEVVTCTGRAGTIVFCDTSGLHRGGYAKEKERLMFTAGYFSEASPRPILLKLSPKLEEEARRLTPSQRFALGK
ncbi:MAG: phytanoyl-CoA dioxygenase family protein [Candidatus Sungbacteria bacterium]|uniref:Phytanoyl-CoA dioxygenase family protein n=1 Tax=Candidatus Sungiibacteriota bacterium TaxID=2750080 RepID=A0A9D6LSD4_9BACT|nr:phytanoyl-CoA dioxygenase family protein [Candidatus Sungbacteria bacterium]